MSKSYNRPLSHQEYLEKKYLSQSDFEAPNKKKKKKSESSVKIKAPTVRIVDDDIDIRNLKRNSDDEEDIHLTKEEKPSVANVIDDRPLAQRGENNAKSKWKCISGSDHDEGDNLNDNSNKSKEKMWSGARAGLSNSKDLKREAKQLKRKQDKLMRSLPDEVSGKNAGAVYRDKSSGKVQDLEKERKDKEEKEAAKKAIQDRLNKGIVQVEKRKQMLETDLHEMSKPLARYKDDDDLAKHLKDQERADDPMLEMFREKKLQERKANDPNFKIYPKYKGPQPDRNRFDILPGYRWDGVNRSNGYEKRYFEQINLKIAQEEEAYKWSTEDM